MSDDSRISPYNLSDLKNTTDDALQNYLISLPSLAQSNFHTDVKLALGYSAVVISAVTFYLDYTQGFEATKTLTTFAVIIYFLLNGAFTYWVWGVEKGTIFTGSWKGRNLAVSSRTNKFDPVYRLAITFDNDSGKKEEIDIDAPFMQWFTEDGFFVAKPFQQWLASSVSLIGQADPKNAIAVPEGQTGSVTTAHGVENPGLQGVLETIKRDNAKAQAKAARRNA